jgi:ABC-type uncharacterized transport system, periplasmic component
MSSARLQQQFIRLWQSCQGLDQETTLSDLAERLHCSRRHMRNLLNAMQDAGWLIWQAEAGRGKRSTLSFNYTGLSTAAAARRGSTGAGPHRAVGATGGR